MPDGHRLRLVTETAEVLKPDSRVLGLVSRNMSLGFRVKALRFRVCYHYLGFGGVI